MISSKPQTYLGLESVTLKVRQSEGTYLQFLIDSVKVFPPQEVVSKDMNFEKFKTVDVVVWSITLSPVGIFTLKPGDRIVRKSGEEYVFETVDARDEVGNYFITAKEVVFGYNK